jgi:hypothetical protein
MTAIPNVFCAKIFDENAGFTNQMIAFASAVIYCKRAHREILVVKDFMREVHTHKTIPVSEVFDMKKMNEYLKKFDIQFVDLNKLNFQIKYLYTKDNHDITSTAVRNNIVYAQGVPPYAVNNLLTMEYTVGGGEDDENRPVPRRSIFLQFQPPRFTIFNYEQNLNLANFPYTFAWLGSLEPPLFEEIFTNLSFHPYFYERAADFAVSAGVLGASAVSVIHLRIEKDTEAFAKQCKMSFEEYQRRQTAEYIRHIQENIPKTDKIVVLCYVREHPVLDFLRENGYDFVMTEKTEDGRELCALVDLLVADLCNSVFIGYFDLESKRGSTYSYFIYMRALARAVRGGAAIRPIMFAI